jgi:general secretion pathway protein I
MLRRNTAGFTLIEVMIAVVILAVGMSALFTSEAGAIRIAQRARTTTVATLLARCKMGEVEEKILKEGWPGDVIEGRDECCTDAEKEGFRCEWKVERVTLPELTADTGGLTAGLTGGPGGAPGSEKGALAAPGAPPLGGGSAGGLAGGEPGGGMEGDGGILGSMITSAGSSGGDSDPFAQMAMELTFPVMKPVIEEGVRRATVTVSWKEGGAEQSFDVVQFIVNEVPMLPDETTTEALQPTGGGTAGIGGAAGGTGGPGGAGGGPGGTAGGNTGGGNPPR